MRPWYHAFRAGVMRESLGPLLAGRPVLEPCFQIAQGLLKRTLGDGAAPRQCRGALERIQPHALWVCPKLDTASEFR